jgi:cell wall-associated NlpC family hydrolase
VRRLRTATVILGAVLAVAGAGAAGPDSFDASGLVVAAYASVGIALPHNTGQLAARTLPVDRGALQDGDLVFYGTDSPSTVAVYIGGDRVVGVFRPGRWWDPTTSTSPPSTATAGFSSNNQS